MMRLKSGVPLLLVLSQWACGSAPQVVGPTPTPIETGPPARAFAYVPDGGGLYGLAIDQAGALSSIPGSPFAGNGPIVIDRAHGFLYVGGGDGIHAYRINFHTGALTEIEGSPFRRSGLGRVSAVDPSGRLLYSASGGEPNCRWHDPLPPPLGRLSVFRIDPTAGSLSDSDGSAFELAINPIAIFPDPLGRYVLVLNGGCDSSGWSASAEMSVFSIEGGDHLSPHRGPFPVPYAVLNADTSVGQPAALNADGDFLYVTHDSGGITTYAVGPDGVPHKRGDMSFGDRLFHVWTGLRFGLGGRLAVASFYNDPPPTPQGVLTLSVDPRTGLLSAGTQVSTAIPANQLALNAPGDRAFHVGIFDSVPQRLYGYAVDPAGDLRPLPGSPILLPEDRYEYYRLFIEPSGRFVYAAIGTDGTGGSSGRIFGYSVAPDTGALSALPGAPFSAASLSLNSLLSQEVLVVPAKP